MIYRHPWHSKECARLLCKFRTDDELFTCCPASKQETRPLTAIRNSQPEDSEDVTVRANVFLQNAGIYLQLYTAIQSRSSLQQRQWGTNLTKGNNFKWRLADIRGRRRSTDRRMCWAMGVRNVTKSVNTAVFFDVVPCSMVEFGWRFRGAYYHRTVNIPEDNYFRFERIW
jgi:hypothetical protein